MFRQFFLEQILVITTQNKAYSSKRSDTESNIHYQFAGQSKLVLFTNRYAFDGYENRKGDVKMYRLRWVRCEKRLECFEGGEQKYQKKYCKNKPDSD